MCPVPAGGSPGTRPRRGHSEARPSAALPLSALRAPPLPLQHFGPPGVGGQPQCPSVGTPASGAPSAPRGCRRGCRGFLRQLGPSVAPPVPARLSPGAWSASPVGGGACNARGCHQRAALGRPRAGALRGRLDLLRLSAHRPEARPSQPGCRLRVAGVTPEGEGAAAPCPPAANTGLVPVGSAVGCHTAHQR